MPDLSLLNSYPFETKSPDEVFSFLNTSAKGLLEEDAKIRSKLYGTNELAVKRKHLFFVQFFSKFLDPLVLILLFASFISLFLGQSANFLIILTIILISVVIDFYQENKSENAVENLRRKVSLTASVLRDGKKQERILSDVVPGDIIFLSAGDIIPADGLLFSSQNLFVNQASLTGESFPQEKNAANPIFMGTHVLSGNGKMAAVRTGKNTEFGKISVELVAKRPLTQFQKGINDFGLMLFRLTLILVTFVFLVNIYFHHNIIESFLFALALAIGLAPEILPIILTVNLAKGALKMAKKGVIVKDLPSIQNFGSMEILCTDKTGTFTEGQINLVSYEDFEQNKSNNILSWGFLVSSAETGLQNPMSQAVVNRAQKEIPLLKIKNAKINEIPYTFDRKRLSVILPDKKNNLLITQGIPEGLLPLCTKYQSSNEEKVFTSSDREKIFQRFQSLSKEGFRVLLLASKPIVSKKSYTVDDEKDLTFIGFLIFSDEIKKTAKEAFKNLEDKGVAIKILTGDNELVTKKICQEAGLFVNNILLGKDIDLIDDDNLMKKVKETDIFARLTPKQKERIILALKKAGKVVGFMGDGINDAPSLRMADVGISVNNAVDIVKESADIILLHKDLHILKEGVMEGRRTYGNIQKYILMGTSSDFGNMMSVAAASLFLPFLPMLPVQILLNDLLYDVTQLTISSDNVDPAFLEKPKKWDLKFIKHFMLIFGSISSLFDFLTFFLLLYFFRSASHLFQTGWFVESLTTQTLIVLSIRTGIVPFFKSKPGFYLVSVLFLIVAFAWIIPLTPLGPIFSFIKLPFNFYLLLLPLFLAYFFLVEITKKWFYRKYHLI